MPHPSDQNLIFLHIPKNGGTTLHGIIDRKYPPHEIFDIKVVNNTRLNTQDFIDLPEEERSQLTVLKGHMLYGLHEYLPSPSRYITFLRNPQDRIVSFYQYVLRRTQHRLYKKIVENNMSLYDFVVNATEGDIHNAQIRWISGIEKGSQDEMLAKALENIDKHFSFVGILEEYDTSVLLLSKLYGWGVPYYQHGKKSAKKSSSIALDSKTIEAIATKNKGDFELYNTIKERFDTQKRDLRFSDLKHKQLQIANAVYTRKDVQKVLKKLRRFT